MAKVTKAKATKKPAKKKVVKTVAKPKQQPVLKAVNNLQPASYTETTRIRRAAAASKGITVVTSSLDGEGSSMLSRLIAQNNAEAGKKTLLVDLNMKNWVLSRELGNGSQKWGLSASKSSINSLIVKLSKVKNLSFMAAPNDDKSIEHLKDTKHAKAFFAKLAKAYDYVIIDTNSIGAFNRNNIDPVMLSGLADNVVLAVMAGRTHRNHVTSAVNQLRNVNAKLNGVVINNYHTPSPRQQLLKLAGRLAPISAPFSSWLRKRILATNNLD